VDLQVSSLCRYVKLLLAYFLLSVGLTLFMTAHRGTNSNYRLETSVPVSLLIPAAWKVVRANTTNVASRRIWALFSTAVAASAALTGARMLRHQYHLWRCRPYLDEIVATIERTCPAGEPCYSVYPELVAKAGRKLYFNEFCQYNGRWPEARQRLLDAVQSGLFSGMVTHTEQPPYGYRRVELANPVPGYWQKAFLHVRADLAGTARGPATAQGTH